MDRCTSRTASSAVQASGISARLFNLSPTDVARWIQRGSNACRERPKQEKISSTFMPDFLPGASVQKRASQCTLSSVYLGRSNKKIEFL